jgi:hypothetical protein
MSDTNLIIAVTAGLAAFLIAIAALLRGWSSWLELKRAQLERSAGPGADYAPASPSPAARIELADLKERVRRLEAIANGVEGQPR